ncbi:MAG TPA: helix-turn-helix domain-containing protein [Pseudonocardiaceae bacterium]
MSFDGAAVGQLRAFSHPLRLRMLELLDTSGPMTATEVAALAGTTPSNASFHLRLLARHGFVEEAEGGSGRQRPWRAVDVTLRVDRDALDGEGRRQLRGLLELMIARYRRTVLAWERTRDDHDRAWREAAGETHQVLHVTAAELSTLSREVHELLTRLTDRPRPADALPVAITFSALPVTEHAARTTSEDQEQEQG